jgi:arabinogalactan oligomer/maltooligosaccharide transport system substrate-binding protein
MKRITSFILCGLLIMGALAGCSKQADSTKETTETTEPTKAAEITPDASDNDTVTEPVELKIWHDGDEAIMAVIASKVNDKLKEDGITVTFEKKTGLTDQIKLYGNDATNGPDMYFYAHDSLGTFVEMGILTPITDVISADVMADLLPMTIEAGTYNDAQYMLPIYFETLLFMYNKDLWKGDIPSTTEELYDYMVANTDTEAGTYAVVNQHSTAYNVAPFINGFGGYIINSDAKPGLNEQATKDAVAYNQKFAQLQADGDYNTVTTLFNEKKAAAIIGGPWLISGINDAGINLGFKSLADFKLPNGNGLAPFSGVQGIGLMKYAVESKKDAIAKVIEVLAGADVGIELAKNSNCAPANSKAYDDAEVAANEMIVAIKDTAQTAKPMPNVPQMGVMWGPTESFLAAVNKSGESVDQSADKYQEEALTAIADMQ